jgi:hypothetical protein
MTTWSPNRPMPPANPLQSSVIGSTMMAASSSASPFGPRLHPLLHRLSNRVATFLVDFVFAATSDVVVRCGIHGSKILRRDCARVVRRVHVTLVFHCTGGGVVVCFVDRNHEETLTRYRCWYQFQQRVPVLHRHYPCRRMAVLRVHRCGRLPPYLPNLPAATINRYEAVFVVVKELVVVLRDPNRRGITLVYHCTGWYSHKISLLVSFPSGDLHRHYPRRRM